MIVEKVGDVSENQAIYNRQDRRIAPSVAVQKVDLNNPVDELKLSTKEDSKTPSTAKKIGIGMASVMLPGLGQFINGDTKKGIGFLAANFALIPLSGVLGPVAGVSAIAIQVASAIDAIRNVK